MTDAFLRYRNDLKAEIRRNCNGAKYQSVSKPIDENDTKYIVRWRTRRLDPELECIIYSIRQVLIRLGINDYSSRNEENPWTQENGEYLWIMRISI